MARPPRIDWDGAIHHVMNRGVNRAPIFFADADRVEFGVRLQDCHQRFGVEVVAYRLMGNHFHLVMRTRDATLSQAMHHLTSTYVRHTNDRVGRDGPLFRGRFRSIPVTTDSYLRQLVRYVHLNPTDLGVARPEEYRWSSYRTYLGLRPRPSFLNTGLVLGLFDDDRERFRAFTTEVGPHAGIMPTNPDELAHVVELVLAAELDGGRNRAHEAVLAALADRLVDPALLSMVGELAAHSSPSAQRVARDRADRRLRGDPQLAQVVDRLVQDLTERRVA